MELGHIRVEPLDAISGGWRVLLHNPDRLNAMSRAMWRELKSVFEQINADASARCVLVEGAGTAFCAGGDISEYPAFRFDEAALRDFHETEVWGALAAMLACDVPLIAQIEGSDPSDKLFDAKVKVLGEYIDHHVKEEEGEMFPQARKAKVDLVALAEQLTARKTELINELAPEEATAG